MRWTDTVTVVNATVVNSLFSKERPPPPPMPSLPGDAAAVEALVAKMTAVPTNWSRGSIFLVRPKDPRAGDGRIFKSRRVPEKRSSGR